MLKYCFILCSTLLFFSCEKFDYSPYEVTKETKLDLNEDYISQLVDDGNDTTTIALIGDSQRFYASTEKVVTAINKHHVDFIAHSGDLVDFGTQNEYMWMHDILKKLHAPYITVIGNHDLIGNGGTIFQNMYGEYDFSFYFKGNKFIYTNTNSREFFFNENVPNIDWLDQQLADTSTYDNAFIIQHVSADNVDFNAEFTEDFINTLNKYGKTTATINGHNHDLSIKWSTATQPLTFINTASTQKEEFILMKIVDNTITLEVIKA